jgi:hypothetical protein
MIRLLTKEEKKYQRPVECIGKPSPLSYFPQRQIIGIAEAITDQHIPDLTSRQSSEPSV